MSFLVQKYDYFNKRNLIALIFIAFNSKTNNQNTATNGLFKIILDKIIVSDAVFNHG